MANSYSIVNPGSALGEAIGASMERALRTLLWEVADEYGCHYLTSGVRQTKAGIKAKKLLMFDNFGNEYDIDGVIANELMQPLILFESKYIRYKKHNRDKGSWVCTAHSSIRRRYHSIRSSIAVLAGNWSNSSIAMMESHDINIFLIPFNYICDVLANYGIEFDWGEKEQEKAYLAWEKYSQLTEREQNEIGQALVSTIIERLVKLIGAVLDDANPREIERVIIELVSNLGEVKVFEFDSVEDAVAFLTEQDLDALFVTSDSVTLFDPPPTYSA